MSVRAGPEARAARPHGAPIALQILGLLLGGLVVAQIATLLVVMVLPPEPIRVYRIGEIAAALEGSSLAAHDGRPLTRSRRETSPWFALRPDRFENRDRRALADVLGVPEERVVLERHRPPPLAGAAALRPARRDEGRRGLFAAQDFPGPPPGAQADRPIGGRDGLFMGQDDATGRPRRPEGAGFPLPPRPGLRGFPTHAERVAFEGARPLVGDFTAALRQPTGGWVVVEPVAEPFLTDWQRRVLFWFMACMVVLAPIAYLFARRITAPIGAFASAAERIGRDPTAPLIALSGPAEIGAAARAMNDMQVRLKRYVQDRTATIAAVSHDLRTPLARMRFKLEKAPPGLKESLTRDVEQMEQMVRAVLEFIREGSEPRRRERVDLLSALECVVDDAASAGRSVELTAGEPVIVEADALGLERLFANLVDNAAKYGAEARVSVRAEGDEGVVEIADRGPGLPESELERVFQPFYRVEPSRSRDTGGIGLGLAVARSIARAHGGEISLARGEPGLIAQVRLPRAAG